MHRELIKRTLFSFYVIFILNMAKVIVLESYENLFRQLVYKSLRIFTIIVTFYLILTFYLSFVTLRTMISQALLELELNSTDHHHHTRSPTNYFFHLLSHCYSVDNRYKPQRSRRRYVLSTV